MRRYSAKMRCPWSVWALVFFLPTLTGCGGCGGSSHLPRPRAPADDEPAVVQATPTPTPKPSPTTATSAEASAKPATVGTLNSSPPLPPGPANDAAEASNRRREASSRLIKIYLALQKFRGQNTRYPDQAIIDREGKWLLSWRVVLLPYLGRQDLYARFKLDEAWNSPHNLPLTREIPDEFKSAERNDDKTCFQLLTGPGAAYEFPAGMSARTCPDGMADTILLVETNPELAKPWTQPDDYKLDPLRIQQDLFTQRQDGAFVLFGGDQGARLLPANVPDDKLLGLITCAGRERVDAESLSRSISPEPYPDLLESLRAAPVTRHIANLLAPKGAPSGTAIASNSDSPVASPAASSDLADTGDSAASSRVPQDAASSDSRLLVPADDKVSEAADQVRQLFADEYKSAKKVEDRRAFAKKLLDESKRVDADPPAYYVMLRAARDVAAAAGDLATALEACGQLRQHFQIDEVATFSKVLEQASTNLTEAAAVQKLYDEAMRLTDLAVERDDFAATKQLLRLAQSSARRLQNPRELAAANRREDEINTARVAFQKITPQLLVILRSPDDPSANSAVGRYTTLIKRDWDKGLAMLAKGDESTLRKLAGDDRASPSEPAAQLSLADAWWEWAEGASSTVEKASARTRASHWYQLAIPGLPAGLARVKAERRVAEVEAPTKVNAKTSRTVSATD